MYRRIVLFANASSLLWCLFFAAGCFTENQDLGTDGDTDSDSDTDTDSETETDTDTGSDSMGPEIQIFQNENELVNGQSEVHFDPTEMAAKMASPGLPFTIRNIGNESLSIYDIIIESKDVKSFELLSTPVAQIEPNSEYMFEIEFLPELLGTFGTNVIISNEDNDEHPFQFSVRATVEDTTPPTVANPIITIVATGCYSIDLSFNPATDYVTEDADLLYLFYYSTEPNLDDIDTIEKNGTLVTNVTSNPFEMHVGDLRAGTIYFFNVVVVDGFENKSMYTMLGAETLNSEC